MPGKLSAKMTHLHLRHCISQGSPEEQNQYTHIHMHKCTHTHTHTHILLFIYIHTHTHPCVYMYHSQGPMWSSPRQEPPG